MAGVLVGVDVTRIARLLDDPDEMHDEAGAREGRLHRVGTRVVDDPHGGRGREAEAFDRWAARAERTRARAEAWPWPARSASSARPSWPFAPVTTMESFGESTTGP